MTAAPKLKRYYVIDFDSTFSKIETLEELLAISLKGNKGRDEIMKGIKEITNAAMEGRLSFAESLEKRMALMKSNKKDVETLVRLLKKNVTPSFARNKKFFKEFGGDVLIFSGAFKEFILPIVKAYGIPEKNVFANTFLYDKKGNIVGYDKKNPLAQKGGKVIQLKNLKLDGEIFVIGDGHSDYELRESGLASKFFAFTENVSRKSVVEKADHVIPTFDEFLYINALPMAHSYPKNRLKVLLLENIHPDAVERFKKEGYGIETMAKSIGEDELCEKIKDVAVLGIRSKTELTKKVLEKANKLMAVGAFCIGTNQIDLAECSRRGIPVFNAPYSNTRSVVELVIGEIIMLMRKVFDKSVKLHGGVWDKSAKNCFEIRGKKLGIIGYGNIGSQLSVVAESLGMEVYFYDIVEKLSIGNAQKCASMEELLRKCDVVAVHVDGQPRNKNIISERELAMMKDGSLLLNLSRGFVIDIPALAKSIKSGKLAGAAIDVYPREPKSNDEKFASELQNLPNVILSPHIGGSTEEAQKNIGEFVSSKIVDFINAGNTYLSVNIPNIQLPALKDAHRFIHIHHNSPGVLAHINGVLAKHKINILGQYLKTDETIGYVITDVSKEYDNAVINELKNVPHTIKFRVLY
ncbi:MAG: phosphoglycerate dehydrogenase [bacterium]|nr:phosphoglycerate dehydrogenase [bacterium]